MREATLTHEMSLLPFTNFKANFQQARKPAINKYDPSRFEQEMMMAADNLSKRIHTDIRKIGSSRKGKNIPFRGLAKVDTHKSLEKIISRKKVSIQDLEIKNQELVIHYGFDLNQELKVSTWSAYFESLNLEKRLAEIKDNSESKGKDDELLVAQADKKVIGEVVNEQAKKVELNEAKIDVMAQKTDREITDSALAAQFEVITKEEIQHNDEVSLTQASTVDTQINDEEQPSDYEINFEKIGSDKTEITNAKANSDQSQQPAKEEFVTGLSQASNLQENQLISSRVSDVISREMKKMNSKKADFKAQIDTGMDNGDEYSDDEGGSSDYTQIDLPQVTQSQQPSQGYLVADNKKQTGALPLIEKSLVAPEADISENISLVVTKFWLNGNKSEAAIGSDFIPDYDKNETFLDDLDGRLQIKRDSDSTQSIMRGMLRVKDARFTILEVNRSDISNNIEIPVVDEESFKDFLSEEKLNDINAHLLIKLNDEVSDVEIEGGKYIKRYLVSDKFKVVEAGQDYEYVLFIGAAAGNTLISYLMDDGSVSEKVVHLSEGMFHYDMSSFLKPTRENFTLHETNLLGVENTELVINGNQITYFNTSNKADASSLNGYSVQRPYLASDMRKYLEMKHMGSSIFVGFSDKKDLQIPSKEYLSYVLGDISKLDNLKDTCLVQVNFSKQVRDVLASGENISGSMPINFQYLDRDGQIATTPNELTKKMFITGEIDGIFNLKVDYFDGSFDNLRTYCSDQTYLVEQL